MLADKLYKLASFKRQYIALLELSVSKTIYKLEPEKNTDTLLKEIDWNNLLGIASGLSYSDKYIHLDAALRIAQTTLIEDSTSTVQKEAAAVVLHTLTNKPAIDLAIKRQRLSSNFEDNLPFSVKLHNIRIDIENSIYLDNNLLPLNKFQKKVHDSYLDNDAVSISAPTSAGKSFILCNIVL